MYVEPGGNACFRKVHAVLMFRVFEFFPSHAIVSKLLLDQLPIVPQVPLASAMDFYSIILVNHRSLIFAAAFQSGRVAKDGRDIKISGFKTSKPIFASIVEHNTFTKNRANWFVRFIGVFPLLEFEYNIEYTIFHRSSCSLPFYKVTFTS